MTIYYQDDYVALYHGDCLDVLASMPDNSVDSIVTDPPYGLGFMGKKWDALPPSLEWAEECLRVLKPGGHIVAFGGTRTWHRLAVAIEDAGFEMRDSLAWLYGSGFPKSLDVSKAIDKRRHDGADIRRVTAWVAATRTAAGITNRDIDAAFGFNGMAGHWTTQGQQAAIPTLDQVPALLAVLGISVEDVPDEIRALLIDLNGMKGQPGPAWFAREVVGTKPSSLGGTVAAGERDQAIIDYHKTKIVNITAPATDDAKRWEGWGTALKPTFEPVVVARKPLAGTVAQNVLAYGTGGLNIDACRVAGEVHPAGRWPANVLLDEHAADHLAEASRFFYTAKASKKERPVVEGEDGTKIQHPTVKPLAIMRWLIRLVTPPGGTVLDPFAGSGTTIEAAMMEGFHPVGIEKETDYLPLITARIARAKTSAQGVLDLGGIA